jgi:hypothetical protein
MILYVTYQKYRDDRKTDPVFMEFNVIKQDN